MRWLIILIAIEAHVSTKLLCIGQLNYILPYIMSSQACPQLPLGKYVYIRVLCCFGERWGVVVGVCSHKLLSCTIFTLVCFCLLEANLQKLHC